MSRRRDGRDPDNPTPSIQGEQQAQRRSTVWASDATVDRKNAQLDEGERACRQRGRHLYAPTGPDLTFTRINEDGWWEREVACDCCRRRTPDDPPWPAPATGAPRVLRIEVYDVRHYRGKITRIELVTTRPGYIDPHYLGEPGQGRMKPRQFRGSAATDALAGQSIIDLRQTVNAAEAQRERERAARITEAVARRNHEAEREAAQLRAVPDVG